MKIIMKTALLFAVLCCSLLPQPSDGQESADAANRICCFGNSNSRIPPKRVEYYYWTGSTCPLKHIVFVTQAKRHLCMNPDDKWVKKVMGIKPGSGSPV